MKIAVAAAGENPQAACDPRFGRCPRFVVVDTETGDFTVVSNDAAAAGSGAGIQAAQTVADAGAQAVIAGSFGPNALEALRAGGIEIYSGATGSVADAIEAWKAGRLQRAT
jgi:predicted Fe-Mo cluster-binding NifX family protein